MEVPLALHHVGVTVSDAFAAIDRYREVFQFLDPEPDPPEGERVPFARRGAWHGCLSLISTPARSASETSEPGPHHEGAHQ